MSFEESIRPIIREEIAAALGALAPALVKPALLDTKGLAFELGVCTKTVDRLRKAKMPCIYVGDNCPRFELAECVTWLQSRPSAA